jgi:hypothetical protein
MALSGQVLNSTSIARPPLPRTTSRRVSTGMPGGRCQASDEAAASTISRSRTLCDPLVIRQLMCDPLCRDRPLRQTCDNFLYGFKGAPAARQPVRPAGPDRTQ